jgi:hypothetical protein
MATKKTSRKPARHQTTLELAIERGFKPLTPESPEVTVSVEIEPEHTPVQGNAMASDDPEADAECEAVILAALERGQTEVSAAGTDLVGRATLGCCSFEPGRSQARLLDALERLNTDLAQTWLDAEPAVVALCKHLGVHPDTVSERHGVFECASEPGEYRVLTDSEADEAADLELEDYIEECILPECPTVVAQYFDRDSWKRDALLSDGRGHTIASYDGAEECETVDGVDYFIYRVN